MRSLERPFVIGAVVAVVLGVALGTAYAMGQSDEQPKTAKDVFSTEMTLQEIARAASGKPGEVAPPCPDAETVVRLKTAGIEFGPCDPLPEAGAPFVVPAPGSPAQEETDSATCPLIKSGKGLPGLDVSLPCAPGARITRVEPVKVDGEWCMTVSYVERSGADPRTETLCKGDTPAVGGVPVGGGTVKEKHAN